ncbi:voltage-dependent anion channel [Aspergillus coremiiformis]|uniref:Voltage-dependent anion channel n=1 Tax=Aspergillus coremiiformis TaxID=138285 RepID=A0A5N6ZH50_9EURO|nr:voltage-dependent anion channel [Aspergillus coremiiformis]
MFDNHDHYIPPGTSHSDIEMLTPQKPEEEKPIGLVSIRERLRHFTWAWYTLTMSGGGLAVLIINQPNTFRGLREIGVAVYILNLVIFALVCSTMALRFILHGNLLESLRHDREGLFFPTFWLSVATIVCGLSRYFGDASNEAFQLALEIIFWIYCVCTLLVAIVQYSFVFSAHKYGLQTMMPSWILPAFPVMLSGTIASVIGGQQPIRAAVPIIGAGVTFQGLGFSISFMMYAHYIGRLMESGLPHSDHRPGMFICVGPPAFTALALVGMSKGLPQDFELLYDTSALEDGRILELLAIATGVFLWALSFWFFCLAVIAVIRSPPKAFHLNWWAMVFPNTGFTLATITLGNALHSEGVKGVGSAMSICIVCMFLFVFVNNVRAVIRKEIMYPGKDEDVSE